MINNKFKKGIGCIIDNFIIAIDSIKVNNILESIINNLSIVNNGKKIKITRICFIKIINDNVILIQLIKKNVINNIIKEIVNTKMNFGVEVYKNIIKVSTLDSSLKLREKSYHYMTGIYTSTIINIRNFRKKSISKIRREESSLDAIQNNIKLIEDASNSGIEYMSNILKKKKSVILYTK